MSVQTIEGVFPEAGTSNKYLSAAQEQVDALYYQVKSSYTKAAGAVGAFVKPVFYAAVNGLSAKIDKLPLRGKGGQAPFAQVGMRYGGENSRHYLNRMFTK